MTEQLYRKILISDDDDDGTHWELQSPDGPLGHADFERAIDAERAVKVWLWIKASLAAQGIPWDAAMLRDVVRGHDELGYSAADERMIALVLNAVADALEVEVARGR